MIKLYEHSIEESLIDKNGFAIDLGCGVDFYFSEALTKYGLKVISVDPNPKIVNVPNNEKIFFENKAIVTDENIKEIEIKIYNDTDAATIIKSKNPDITSSISTSIIQTVTIKELMKKYSIKQFEIMKIDIEGMEYELLMSFDKPISKQICVEFHDFRNFNPYYPNNEKYYNLLIQKLSKWYDIVKHKLEIHHGMPSNCNKNYWDSLFILKNN